MKYVIKIDRRPGYETVTGHAPQFGHQLDSDETRRVLIDALEIITDQRAKALTS